MYRTGRYTDWDRDRDTCHLLGKGAQRNMATVHHLRTLVVMQDVIEGVLMSMLPRIFIDSDGRFDCVSVPQCQGILLNMRKEITMKILETRDPLSVLEELWERANESDLCNSCQEAASAEIVAARRKLWSRISTYVHS